MTDVLFAAIMDRSRLDRLEHEIALYVVELLTTYANGGNKVHRALLDAGRKVFSNQYRSLHAFDDVIISEAERLLRLGRKHDGAWNYQPDQTDLAIAAAANKIDAIPEDIETEIIAEAMRFEDMGYKPVEIGRALARVGLTFAPIRYIALEHDTRKESAKGRDERLKEFLDDALGKDRYTSGKKMH
jgi:hypothetical protein